MAVGRRSTAQAVGRTPESPEHASSPPCHRYIKADGEWKYLYQFVDKGSNVIDLRFCATRHMAIALRF